MKKSMFALMALSLVAAACTPSAQPSSTSSISLPSSSAQSKESSSLPSVLTSSSSSSSQSSSSSSSKTDNLATFTEVTKMLTEGFARYEGKASSETSTHSSKRDNFETVTVESASLYSDGSSRILGTETKTGSAATTYEKRATVQTDKMNLGDSVRNLKVLAEVTDYADEKKEDKASKQYVFDTANAAAEYGLSDGEFVYSSQAEFLGSLQLVQTLYAYAANLASSAYVSQTNVKGFTFVPNADGDLVYSTDVSFSYTEDGIIQELSYVGSFTIDEELNRLLSIDLKTTQKETRENDPTDFSVYTDSVVGSITYGAKSTADANAINVNDYFLTAMKDATLLNASRDAIEGNTVYYGTTTYLFAKPTAYLPAKAANVSEWTLTPTASNNEEAIAFTKDNSGSYFEIKGVGTATLTWSYYGQNEDGVWEERSFQKEVTVAYKDIDSISFTNSFTPAVTNKSLTVGNIYSQIIKIDPTYGKGTIVASSANPDALAVSVEQSGSYVCLKLTPLQAGVVTVTAKVDGKNATAIRETFTISAIPANEVPDILYAGPWTIHDLYLEDITLNFTKEGGTWSNTFNTSGGDTKTIGGDMFFKVQTDGKVKITSFLRDDTEEEYGYFNDHFAENAGILSITPEGNYVLTIGSDTYKKDYKFTRQ